MPTNHLTQRNRELELVNRISQALNGTVHIRAALDIVLDASADYFNLETGWIWLQNETDGYYLAASKNLPPGLSDYPKRMTGRCYCLDVYRDGDLQSAEQINTITCTRLRYLQSGTNDLLFHVSIPLNAQSADAPNTTQRLGLLNLASVDARTLSDSELALLHTVGDMLAIAIERNRLFEQSQQLGIIAERNRLAREIHDTLAQSLAGITLQLESADLLLASNPDRASRAIQKALALSRSSLDDARRSVIDLRASPLEQATLPDALRQLAAERDLPARFDFVDTDRPLDKNIAMGLFRIAAEALTNIANHAHANSVTIRLVCQPKTITLTVQDDGVGFDTSRVSAERFGLRGMQERARLLNGTLTIHTTPGSGTEIVAQIPTT